MTGFTTSQAAQPAEIDRNAIIEMLMNEHFFNVEKLLEWPSRMMSAEWWHSPPPEVLNYSPALACFLREGWALDDEPDTTFDEEMAAVVGALYSARGWRNYGVYAFGMEMHPVYDGFLLLLASHVDRLKTVWRLATDPMLKDFPANPDALAYLDAATQGAQTDFGFSDWVLDTWMPAHVLYYGRAAIGEEEREKLAGSGKRGGGPGSHDPEGPAPRLC